MERRAGVILNPVAGKKRGKAMLGDLCEGLCNEDFDVTVGVTKGQGNARALASRYVQELDLICCLGGDGTLNEVISGMMTVEKAVRAPICYIPTGTTNDFASTCSTPRDVSSAIACVRQGKTVKVDIGSFEERFFTYIASFGIFTRTSYSADQNAKNMLGHMAYILEGAKELQDLGKKYRVKVTCDAGTFEDDYIFGGVTNTTTIGGVFQLPKKSVMLNDGKFELLLIRYPSSADELLRILNMMQTGVFDGELILFLQTGFAEFSARTPISWCLDGEFAGERETVRIQNNKRALKLYSEIGAPLRSPEDTNGI